MPRPILRFLRASAPALSAALLLSACATAPAPRAEARPPSVLGDRGSDMALDLAIVRPLGIIGTALGTVGYIVSLPFTLPTGSAGEAGHHLVVKPFEYTFNRPLGDFERCGAERYPCAATYTNSYPR